MYVRVSVRCLSVDTLRALYPGQMAAVRGVSLGWGVLPYSGLFLTGGPCGRV